MQRYKFVLAGTAAGVAGVLAFPTHGGHLSIPSATASGTTTGGSSTSGTSSTAAGSSATTTSPSGPGTTTPPSTGTTGASTSTTAATRSATSVSEPYPYGQLSVKVTVTGPKITGVSIASLYDTDGRSAAIDNYAIPQLEQQVISANSVNINGVSGATFTSQAFVNGVANALQKLGL